jgi:hypothetical protein
MLEKGTLAEGSIVKIAQTFRSGNNDIDAIDFVDMFLADEEQTNPDCRERPVRARQLPTRGHEPELADGLGRRGVRRHLRSSPVLPEPAAL